MAIILKILITMVLTSLGAGLLGAGTSILGNVLGFGSQQSTNKANMELAKYQYARNVEMWNMQNDYNTPLNQRKRIEAAGFNPNLVYGHGSLVNTSSSSPQYIAPNLQAYTDFKNSGDSFVNNYLSTRSNLASVDNVKADTAKKYEEVLEKRSQSWKNLSEVALNQEKASYQKRLTELQELLNQFEKSKAVYYDSTAAALYDKLCAERDHYDALVRGIESQIDVNKSNIRFQDGPKTALTYSQVGETDSRTVLNRLNSVDVEQSINRNNIFLSWQKRQLIYSVQNLAKDLDLKASELRGKNADLVYKEIVSKFYKSNPWIVELGLGFQVFNSVLEPILRTIGANSDALRSVAAFIK